MNGLSTHLLSWLFWTSVHVVALVGLVLVVDRATRRFLSPGWRHALWVLALVPLVCPVLPTSRWSPLNLVRMATGRTEAESRPMAMDVSVRSAGKTEIPAQAASPVSQPGGLAAEEMASLRILPSVLASLWAVGVLALLLRQWRVASGFRRRARGGQAVADAAMLNELAECCRTLGLRRTVRVVETDAVGSPALTGVFRPTILLPAGLLGELSADERQCLFLHELAHVKRWDLALDALAGFCQVLYWFNPAVHLAAARLRTTRETACDARVLRTRGVPDWPRQYSRTLLKLASRSNSLIAMPAMAGMAERTSSIETRLVAIQQFGPAKLRRHVLGMGIVALVAAVGLSRAGDPKAPEPQSAQPVEPPSESPCPVASSAPAAAEKKIPFPQITLASNYIEVSAESLEVLEERVAMCVPAKLTPVRSPGGDTVRMTIASTADVEKALREAWKASNRPNTRLWLDVLSSPKVTTLDGKTAIIRMIEERYFPIGWSRLDVNGKPNAEKGPDGAPKVLPVFGDSLDVGTTTKLTPRLPPGGRVVDLEVSAKLVEELGWNENTKTKDARDPATEVLGAMPILRTRLVEGRAVIPVGSTACFVYSPVLDEEERTRGVPVLSSIPGIGKALQNTERKPIVKGLIFLVTPTIIRKGEASQLPAKSEPKEPTRIDWGE